MTTALAPALGMLELSSIARGIGLAQRSLASQSFHTHATSCAVRSASPTATCCRPDRKKGRPAPVALIGTLDIVLGEVDR